MATATVSSTSSAAAASGGESSGTAASEAAARLVDDSRLTEPLRAERRESHQPEKEIRTLLLQLNRFSEINPEEYARLQEAERQKQILEQQMELRERQMEEASAQKVAMPGARSLTSSKGSSAPAAASAPAVTARTCSNRSTARASPCAGTTAGR